MYWWLNNTQHFRLQPLNMHICSWLLHPFLSQNLHFLYPLLLKLTHSSRPLQCIWHRVGPWTPGSLMWLCVLSLTGGTGHMLQPHKGRPIVCVTYSSLTAATGFHSSAAWRGVLWSKLAEPLILLSGHCVKGSSLRRPAEGTASRREVTPTDAWELSGSVRPGCSGFGNSCCTCSWSAWVYRE